MRRMRSESGQSLIEFAVFFPLLLFMVSGIIDLSAYIQAAIQVQTAAEVGAEYGTYPGNKSNTSGMQTWAAYAASNSQADVGNFTATASDQYSCTAGGALQTSVPVCASNAPYEYVRVVTQGDYHAIVGFVKIPGSLTLHGFAQYEVQ